MTTRPDLARRTSKVPGSFDNGDEAVYRAQDLESPRADTTDHHSSSLDVPSDLGSLLPRDENSEVGNSTMEEQEMRQKLGDVESSFVPELSHLVRSGEYGPGPDETVAGGGVPTANVPVRRRPDPIDASRSFQDFQSEPSDHPGASLSSPQTPPGAYKTPGPEQQRMRLLPDQRRTPDMPNTSSLETMSSSPTAAAAQRTVSKVQSMATLGGYETADEISTPVDQDEATPRKNRPSTSHLLPSLPQRGVDGHFEATDEMSSRVSQRPKYLNSRASHQRLSHSSLASTGTDASDATLGADFALQSGGALPEPRLHRQPNMTLSRSASLGSIVSGVSGMSDDEGTSKRTAVGPTPDLSTLPEEASPPGQKRSPADGPLTPKASAHSLSMPTDTVIANYVRDMEVPGTFARQYRHQQQQQQQQQQHDPSVSRETNSTLAGMTPGPKRGMTWKEHRSTVERLGKENFDLKMKIHFLDQALQKRSEDGVKDMITENVQLKSDRLRLEKDNHTLKKQVRELQRKLDASGARDSPGADQGYGTDDDRSPTAAEEVVYLRERLESTEVEMEKLRTESIARESEKRRLAEMIRSLGDTRTATSDVGSREERDMWKDMLEAETIAREQSEEDNKKLREEIARLRHDTFGPGRARAHPSGKTGSVVSRSSSAEAHAVRAESGELERLRHEVSELQKMIGAQASTLTSRNKEKERLYQEIEDLKIGRMAGRGVRSVAGDSILDRSASRARSHSRASNGTRFSRLSDAERESLDTQIGELRDQVSALKLDNQNLQGQLDELLLDFQALDEQAQADADQYNEELHLLVQERDQAVQDAEDQEVAFQHLRNEFQQEIDGIGDELDAKVDECARLEAELKLRADNVNALQAEMRSAADGLVRLEEDSQNNLARYHAVQTELEDATRELENVEKQLAESESKIQRLTVQQESSHNEIAFLREEQDGDKIKIGDLESLLKKVHLHFDSEKEKTRDLERRLQEERQQRETIESTSKAEIQRVINDLNREAASAKDESRRIRKALSSREMEASTYKDRLDELENSLRSVLGLPDPQVTRAHLISTVTRIQRSLDHTTIDLEATRRRLDEREILLQSRDALLESSALEHRKLADQLERERQNRRQDKHSFDQALKSHQQSAKALSANSARVLELEQGRQADRRKFAQLESQYKDQLAERNAVLLSIWKRLSAMCGPDWAHNNSLINGNLPSQEVIGNMLFWPGFSRNLQLAAKQVEGTLGNVKERIKRVERDLRSDYHSLEHDFQLRSKKLERIEEAWERMKMQQAAIDAASGTSSRGDHSGKHEPDIKRLAGENRLLKAELSLLQQQHSHAHFRAHGPGHERGPSRQSVLSSDTASSTTGGGIPARGSSMRNHTNSSSGRNSSLMRHHSTNIVEHLNAASVSGTTMRGGLGGELMIPAGPFNAPANGNFPAPPQTADSTTSGTGQASAQTQEKWIHRLRELERRLKAEREARLLDRSGARRRLEERDAVNEELRMELERERLRREGWVLSTPDNEQEVARRGNTTGPSADAGSMKVDWDVKRIGELEGSPGKKMG